MKPEVGEFPRAIMFDFDGVIVDSTRVKKEGFRTLFSGYEPELVEQIVEYHRLKGGLSRVEKIIHAYAHILKEPLPPEELERMAARYSGLVLERVVEAAWVPGAMEFLESRKGQLPMFIISGTPEQELATIVERRGITGYFNEVLGSPVSKSAHIAMLLKKYRLQAGSCVFVGDAMTDYEAAMDTGTRFIGIRGENSFPAGTEVLADCRELGPAIASIRC